MDLALVVFAQIALPILMGIVVIALSPRWPRVGLSPLITAFLLYVVLATLSALTAPGSAMWVPAIGGLVSVVVCVAVFVALRRRLVAGPGQGSGGIR